MKAKPPPKRGPAKSTAAKAAAPPAAAAKSAPAREPKQPAAPPPDAAPAPALLPPGDAPIETRKEVPTVQTPALPPLPADIPTFCGIASFKDVPEPILENYKFTSCRFVSFEGIDRFQSACFLSITNSLFTSFKYTCKLPNLKRLNLSGSPLSHQIHYRLMALYAFGDQLELIDDQPVSLSERLILKTFSSSEPLLSDYVRSGHLIFAQLTEAHLDEIQRKMSKVPTLSRPFPTSPFGEPFRPFIDRQSLNSEIASAIRTLENVDGAGVEREISTRLKAARLHAVVCDPVSILIAPRIEALSAWSDVTPVTAGVTGRLKNAIAEVRKRSAAPAPVSDNRNAEMAYRGCILMLKAIDGWATAVEKHKSFGPDLLMQESRNLREVCRHRPTYVEGTIVQHISKLFGSLKFEASLRSQVLARADIPIALLKKSFAPEYFDEIAEIARGALAEVEKAADTVPPEVVEKVRAILRDLIAFAGFVRENTREIERTYREIPTFAELDGIIQTAHFDCLRMVRDFYEKEVKDSLKAKVDEICDPRKEIAQRRGQVTEEVEDVAKFLTNAKKWREETGQTVVLFSEMCSTEEQPSMKDLLIEVSRKEDELQRLKDRAGHSG